MSDDKKRDRALQRQVRARQAKTGESYQAAWRQLTEENAETVPALDETSQAAPKEDLSSTLARRFLALQASLVPPHQPTRVAVQAKEAIDIERLFISGAGTEGGAANWIVNDLEVDGRSQLAMKDLSGALFGTRGVAANQKATTAFMMSGLDPVERGHELAVIVTYNGPNPEGHPLFASVLGTAPPQRPTIIPITAEALKSVTKTTILARVQNATFQPTRLEIDDGDTAGGTADWIIDDLRIDGKTQFVQAGSLPGDMFSTSAIDSFITLDECAPGSAIEVDVTYIGLDESASFTARLEGTVVRADHSLPPPDLHVTLEINGQRSTVIATCDWRVS